jgi:hypothetical protein
MERLAAEGFADGFCSQPRPPGLAVLAVLAVLAAVVRLTPEWLLLA